MPRARCGDCPPTSTAGESEAARGGGGRMCCPTSSLWKPTSTSGIALTTGGRGPIPIWRWPAANWGAVSHAFAEAAVDLGHPWHDDLNAPDNTGVSPVPWHLNVQGRVSSNDAYLDPARDRLNLEVRGLTQVDCIRVSGRRAVGV